MDFDQIAKRLEWLDEEHRKDKAAIGTLENRIIAIENSLDTFKKDIKDLGKKITELGPLAGRISQFEESIAKQRVDIIQMLEEMEKKHTRHEKEATKRYHEGIEEVKKALPPLDQSKDIPELKKMIKERADEFIRVNISVTELKQKVDESIRRSEDALQAQKLIEDSRRQDVKRVADLQGEITAVRKRVDDFRQKTDLHEDTIRRVENRFGELLASETSRKQVQTAFLEKQAINQLERDRAYKEWVEKLESLKLQTTNFDTQALALEESVRAAKRAQDTYIDLNQKLERRINEITEMQRLGEDRLRQEWVTFKADDQKRWTGYTLSTEESIRDIRKTVDRYEERITTIDDMSQNVQDLLHQTTDATEQQLQDLMNVFHEWLTAYERIMGHVRKPQK